MEGTDPVNKKLAGALCGGAVLALALTGCGDSGAQTDAWAKKVCDQVKPQVGKIQQANTSINKASGNSSSAAVAKTDAAAFQQISEAYKALGNAVDSAGVPPVDQGAKVHSDAVKELKRLSTRYAALGKSVQQLDTKDQAKFAKGLQGLAGQLDSLGRSGGQALRQLQSGDLGAAMAKQKGCKRAAPTGS